MPPEQYPEPEYDWRREPEPNPGQKFRTVSGTGSGTAGRRTAPEPPAHRPAQGVVLFRVAMIVAIVVTFSAGWILVKSSGSNTPADIKKTLEPVVAGLDRVANDLGAVAGRVTELEKRPVMPATIPTDAIATVVEQELKPVKDDLARAKEDATKTSERLKSLEEKPPVPVAPAPAPVPAAPAPDPAPPAAAPPAASTTASPTPAVANSALIADLADKRGAVAKAAAYRLIRRSDAIKELVAAYAAGDDLMKRRVRWCVGKMGEPARLWLNRALANPDDSSPSFLTAVEEIVGEPPAPLLAEPEPAVPEPIPSRSKATKPRKSITLSGRGKWEWYDEEGKYHYVIETK